jgi:hypothetical protein
MAAFNKFDAFVEALAEKVHNLGSDTLKVYLTNDTPSASADAVKADLAEITPGNGYTAGGNTAAQTSSSQTGGLYKLVLGDPATWTASGGNIGPFRYAVLYNDTTASENLIGYWDYGTSITLGAGDTFTVDFDPTTGVLTLQ